MLSGAALALAAPSWQEEMALRDSLHRVHPRLRNRWLDKRGITLPGESAPLPASRDSGPLRLAGKYGRGPAVEVTGRGTLVALTLGSEVALLSFANPDSPVVLSEIQLDVIPRQSALYDSFLVTSDDGIEFWSISDPRAPVKRSSIPYMTGDFAIADTLLFFVRGDTFHAYSIADPVHPYQLGRCAEGGYVMAATTNVAVVQAPGDVVDFIDVSNPSAPHRAGTYPDFMLGAAVRGNLCCMVTYWITDDDNCRFDVLDISDLANVRRIAHIDGVGGYDVHLSGPLAFVSGYQYAEWEFAMVDIADSTRPSVVSRCTTSGYNEAVWADWTSNYAYVADRIGLTVVDISNLNQPVVDTCFMKASYAYDVYVYGNRAYVADYTGGLKVLDVSDPDTPTELGGADSIHATSEAVVANDSFAFIGWWPRPYLRSFDVTDPAHPALAGGLVTETKPMDMALRDTLIYLAGRLRFNVVNVARPRQPVLVGSCVTGDLQTAGISLQGRYAYVAGAYDGLYIVDVIDPRNPAPVRILSGLRSSGCKVRDTLLYFPDNDDSLHIFSVANLYAVYQIGAVGFDADVWDVDLLDNLAFVASIQAVNVVDVSDPRNPVLIGRYQTPDDVWQLTVESGRLYAASFAAGVCIFDTAHVAVAEPRSEPKQRGSARLRPPSVAKGAMRVESGGGRVRLFDVAGKKAAELKSGVNDVSRIPAGIYFVRTDSGQVHKLILQR